MAHSRTAKKAVRQNETRAERNRWRLRTLRSAVKDFNEAILHGTVEKATEEFFKCQKVLDRSASKGIIHKNQASRRKSRLSARLVAKKSAPAVAAKK